MKKLLTLLVVFPLIIPTQSMAAGPFEEKDFEWDPFKSLYKRVIIVGVNRMARENPKCETIDPSTLQHYGGTPDDPEFVITCGEPGNTTRVHFTKAEITGDPATNVPLEDRGKR